MECNEALIKPTGLLGTRSQGVGVNISSLALTSNRSGNPRGGSRLGGVFGNFGLLTTEAMISRCHSINSALSLAYLQALY